MLVVLGGALDELLVGGSSTGRGVLGVGTTVGGGWRVPVGVPELAGGGALPLDGGP